MTAWGGVRRLAPRVVVAMLLVEVAWSLFVNYVVFRSEAVLAVVRATHGLVGLTLIGCTLGLVAIVGGVLVGWGGARSAELGLRAADVPRAVAVTLAVWIALNASALAYDVLSGTPIALAPEWHFPTWRAGEWLGQFFGNALLEEIVSRAVLVTQLALWLARDTEHGRRGTLAISLLISQAVFMLGHIPNRLSQDLWASPLAAVGDLALMWVMGLVLAAIWLRTRNLLIAVGLHALANISGHVVAAPAWLIDVVMIAAFVVLMVKPDVGKQRRVVVHGAQCT